MPRENFASAIIAGRQAKAVPLYKSSVGQKVLVGLTGLFLCSFLVVHLSGNLLLFRNDGGKAFDAYSEFMSTNAGIRTMEIVLAAGFLIHVILAVQMWVTNRLARPRHYVMTRPSENSSLDSRSAFVTGSIIFVFLVVHLRSFVVPVRFSTGIKPSMYKLVVWAFENPVYDGFYLIALALLGYHLRHGFQSAFQTFGLRPGRIKWIELVAIVFWLIIPIGFAAMPLYFYWAHFKGVN
jgi:succinate dehydrogenase / fumarate reductase, cytochrome b subunit